MIKKVVALFMRFFVKLYFKLDKESYCYCKGGIIMINTVLNVDDICQDCPYFSTETNHTTNYDGIHMIYISCEHRDLCDHLRKHIEKEMNKKMIKLGRSVNN